MLARTLDLTTTKTTVGQTKPTAISQPKSCQHNTTIHTQKLNDNEIIS